MGQAAGIVGVTQSAAGMDGIWFTVSAEDAERAKSMLLSDIQEFFLPIEAEGLPDERYRADRRMVSFELPVEKAQVNPSDEDAHAIQITLASREVQNYHDDYP